MTEKPFTEVMFETGYPCAVRSDATTVWAWNCLDRLDVRVLAAREDVAGSVWTFVAMSGGGIAMQGQVHGGRHRAKALMRGIRDALTARAMRKRNKNRKSSKMEE